MTKKEYYLELLKESFYYYEMKDIMQLARQDKEITYNDYQALSRYEIYKRRTISRII